MTMSPYFDEEIKLVDAAASISFDSAAENHDNFDWSYIGVGKAYTVYGGSERACSHGAAALLEALGFRYYGQGEFWTKRPSTITQNLTAPKQQFWMNNNRVWFAYSSSWTGYSSDSTAFGTAMTRWQTLTGMGPTSPAPVGHRWDGIIESNVNVGSSTLAAWFTANPQYVDRTGGNPTFALTTLTPAEYDILVEVVASELLRNGLNEYNRTNFDCEDGSLAPSSVVFPFAKRVVDKVRSGTNPVGPHTSSRAGVPTAQIGLYAYAGHRVPPPAGDYSGLYVDIALGFSTAGYGTYPNLVRAHSTNGGYDFIGLREYWDTEVGSLSQPLRMRINKDGYFDVYDTYKSYNADGVNAEFQSNWIVTSFGARAGVKKIRTGATVTADAITEVVDDIFNGDPAAQSLYELWLNPLKTWHKWSLKESMDLINDMEESVYKEYFKKCAVIWYELLTLPEQQTAVDNPTTYRTSNDPFYVKFPILMSHIWSIRNQFLLHSYALVRRLANGAVAANYPNYRYSNASINFDAKTGAFTVGATITGGTSGKKAKILEIIDNGSTGTLLLDNPPAFVDNEQITDGLGGGATTNGVTFRADWYANPTEPTEQNWLDAYAAATAEATREAVFDSTDLVLMHNVTPLATGTPDSAFEIDTGSALLVHVGEGYVQKTGEVVPFDENGDPLPKITEDTPINFTDTGIHFIEHESGNFVYKAFGGNLFLSLFPRIDIPPGTPGTRTWAWKPSRVAGQECVEASGYITFIDDEGSKRIYPVTSDSYSVTSAELNTGQLAIDVQNTTGKTSLFDMNTYVSLSGSTILAPRELIEEDYPNLGKIIKT